MESQVNTLQRHTDQKFKEEFQSFNKKVDVKLDKNKEEIRKMIGEYKNEIQSKIKNQSEMLKVFQQNNKDLLKSGMPQYNYSFPLNRVFLEKFLN